MVIRYVMSISELLIMATTNGTNITYSSACKVFEAAAWSLRLKSKSTSECVRRKHSKINDLRDKRAMRVGGSCLPTAAVLRGAAREKQPAGIGCFQPHFSHKMPSPDSLPFFQKPSSTRKISSITFTQKNVNQKFLLWWFLFYQNRQGDVKYFPLDFFR